MDRQFKRRHIIKRFGQWAVTSYGIENLTGPDDYDIHRERLHHPWWSDHMAEKNWVNIHDFNAALMFAREYFGIEAGDDDRNMKASRNSGLLASTL